MTGAPAQQDGLSSPTEPSCTVSALTGFDPSRTEDYETLYAWAFNAMLESDGREEDELPIVIGGAVLEFRDLRRILDWTLGKAHAEIEAIAIETRQGGDAKQAPSPSDESAAIAQHIANLDGDD